jgi:hypothetical protein
VWLPVIVVRSDDRSGSTFGCRRPEKVFNTSDNHVDRLADISGREKALPAGYARNQPYFLWGIHTEKH